MHDDVVLDEASAIRERIVNDQHSFDVIVSVKLQSNTPERNEIILIARLEQIMSSKNKTRFTDSQRG